METISIRQATLADAAAVACLMNQFDGTDATPDQVAARMQASAAFLTVYLAEVDEEAAGFACLRLLPVLQGDAPYAELAELYVDSAFRRRGVGRALIAHVGAVAQAAGTHEIVLVTDFTNRVAQAAYRQAGYADHALSMRKPFPDDPCMGPEQPTP